MAPKILAFIVSLVTVMNVCNFTVNICLSALVYVFLYGTGCCIHGT